MTAADTRNANCIAEAKAALQLAMTHGWERVPEKTNTVRRLVEHPTPDRTPKSWWARPTYDSIEFVTLMVHDGRITGAVYATTRCPWVTRQDRSISVKRALDILRDPQLSDVHLNH